MTKLNKKVLIELEAENKIIDTIQDSIFSKNNKIDFITIDYKTNEIEHKYFLNKLHVHKKRIFLVSFTMENDKYTMLQRYVELTNVIEKQDNKYIQHTHYEIVSNIINDN